MGRSLQSDWRAKWPGRPCIRQSHDRACGAGRLAGPGGCECALSSRCCPVRPHGVSQASGGVTWLHPDGVRCLVGGEKLSPEGWAAPTRGAASPLAPVRGTDAWAGLMPPSRRPRDDAYGAGSGAAHRSAGRASSQGSPGGAGPAPDRSGRRPGPGGRAGAVCRAASGQRGDQFLSLACLARRQVRAGGSRIDRAPQARRLLAVRRPPADRELRLL